MDIRDEIDFDGIKIRAIPAYNTGKSFHPKGGGLGFIIESEGKRIYHAGDTDIIPEMGGIEGITVALLPVGGTYTMDVKEAVKAARMINPRIAVPMHYGKLVGSEKDALKFKKLVEEKTSTVTVEILGGMDLKI
jgi:L-ascorbate metabolism protein UlaG (beta-lactamase superfamily)